MAKEIQVSKADGTVDTYKSSLFHGYHVKQARDGLCITEKRLFRPERTVQCYPNRAVHGVSVDRCLPCEALNPTQRTR